MLGIMSTLLLAPRIAQTQIAFEDVTQSYGITHSGISWGVVWADFDGDDRPVWAGNHNRWPPRLYQNRADGTFEDLISSLVNARMSGDRHGAAWADFDNDGDFDLISVEGDSLWFDGPPNQLLVNDMDVDVYMVCNRGVSNSSNILLENI